LTEKYIGEGYAKLYEKEIESMKKLASIEGSKGKFFFFFWFLSNFNSNFLFVFSFVGWKLWRKSLVKNTNNNNKHNHKHKHKHKTQNTKHKTQTLRYALQNMIEEGKFKSSDNVLFIHTGGIFGLMGERQSFQ